VRLRRLGDASEVSMLRWSEAQGGVEDCDASEVSMVDGGAVRGAKQSEQSGLAYMKRTELSWKSKGVIV
jgi:hypothetical protein